MNLDSINTSYAKNSSSKFRKTQNYLKRNGFIRSNKHSIEDIEKAFIK